MLLPAAKRQVNIWRRSKKKKKKKKKVTLAFLLPFWPLCLEYFQLVWRQSTAVSFALYKSRRRYAINNFIFAYAIELALYRTQTLI